MSIEKRVPTKEQLELIRDGIMLPIMLKMVNNSRQEMDQERNSLKAYYLNSASALVRRIQGEI